MEEFSPTDAAETRDVVAESVAAKNRLDLRGAGSKTDQGASVEADAILNLGGLTGIVDYEPAELVLTARPGTPLSEIEAMLAECGQHLAFEPPGTGAGATLGGVLACNDSGPRRATAGAARDHFLGVTAVSGRGEAFKSGGRVIKNVTGYDLPKLLAGSWGTLAAMTEVTVKVLPVPEDTATVVLFALHPAAAVDAMGRAVGSPNEVSGLAHLPAPISARSNIGEISGSGTAVTVLRVEGLASSVAHRAGALQVMFPDHASAILDRDTSQNLWSEIRERKLLGMPHVLWRLSAPPASGAAVAEEISAGADAEFLFDWAGGRIWVALTGVTAREDLVRGAVARSGGHATLQRAPAAVRASVPVCPPLAPEVSALQQRIKTGFDPLGILSPGRMGAF